MQVTQRGRHSLAAALQDDIIGGRVSGASVETQREGKVLTVAQQLISQVRHCREGEQLSLKIIRRWKGSDRKEGQHEKVGQGAGLVSTWCLQVNWTAICGDHLYVPMFGRPAEVNFLRIDFRSRRERPALWTWKHNSAHLSRNSTTTKTHQ